MFSAGRNEDAKKALRRIATHYPGTVILFSWALILHSDANIDEKFIEQVEYSTQLDMNSDKDRHSTYVYQSLSLFRK